VLPDIGPDLFSISYAKAVAIIRLFESPIGKSMDAFTDLSGLPGRLIGLALYDDEVGIVETLRFLATASYDKRPEEFESPCLRLDTIHERREFFNLYWERKDTEIVTPDLKFIREIEEAAKTAAAFSTYEDG
jgi:hypothetical protein